jgi:IPT/TIG domain
MKLLRTIAGAFLVVLILSTLLTTTIVHAAPAISISPSTGVSGTTVTITGSSFSSYSGDVLSVYFDDTEIVSSVSTVSSAGVFQSSLKIPDYTKSGDHNISLRGKAGTALAESKFIVPPTELILNNWGGPVGTTVKAFCKGFYAGQKVSVQYYSTENREEVATAIASDGGECTVEFNIPVSATGTHQIIAANENGDYAQADFEIVPSLNISPPNGTVGDKVDVLGSGFIGNSEVSVTLNGEKVAYAQVYERGNFDAIFNVPAIKAGTYAVEIEDASHTKRWIDFTVDSRISLSKASGEVGTKLTVTGTGFEGGAIIIFQYDTAEISWTVADDSGSFSFTFNVPASIAGAHFITVTDGFNTKQAVFSVESQPPSAPNPINPKPDAKVEAQVPFDWESVYDPSEPVLYTLQISRDDSFFNPILVKMHLSQSQYVLTPQEALRPNRRFTHYYWRVRATDAASNIGDWSDPVQFQVEPIHVLPQWAKYTLGAVGFLMVVLLINRIVRGTAKPKALKKHPD